MRGRRIVGLAVGVGLGLGAAVGLAAAAVASDASGSAGQAVASVAGALAGPLGQIERVPAVPFDAVVAERIDGGGYSYLRLDDGRWVVGLDKGHAVGDAVRVTPIGVAHAFVSRRTGRTFDPLLFAVLARP